MNLFSRIRERFAGAAIDVGVFGPANIQPTADRIQIEHRDEVTQHGYILELSPSYEEVYDPITGETHDLPGERGTQLEMYETRDVKKERKRLIAAGKKFMVAMTMEEAANLHTRITFGFASPETDARTRRAETKATPERIAQMYGYVEPSAEYRAKVEAARAAEQ